MKAILPIIGMVITALVTLTALVFCMGMGANSTPAQIRTLKLSMAGLTLFGLAGIATSIVLLRAEKYGWSAGAAFTPAAVLFIVFVVLVVK